MKAENIDLEKFKKFYDAGFEREKIMELFGIGSLQTYYRIVEKVDPNYKKMHRVQTKEAELDLEPKKYNTWKPQAHEVIIRGVKYIDKTEFFT